MWARAALLAIALVATSGAAAGDLSHERLPRHGPGWDESPSDWAPDGRRIVFQRLYEPLPQEVQPHLIELGVAAVDGSGARSLVHQPRIDAEVWDFGGQWSPDGTTIAFTRKLGLEGSELMVVNAAGGVARDVTPPAGTPDLEFAPDWSPDSRLIAFSRENYDQPSREGIWITRPDGAGQAQLTRGEDYVPIWAPDGSAIAFTRVVKRGSNDPSAIYTIRPDGTSLRQIVGPGDNDVFGWSPDSSLILFQRGTDTGNASIWSMRRDGSGKRRLVRGHSPNWSPDGTKLLFGQGRAKLYVANRDGGNARVLFEGASSGIWSPDGTRVAVASRRGCVGLGVDVVRVDRFARRITNDCRILGTAAADRVRGTNERDLIYGLGGNDVIDANPGDRKIEYFRRFDDDVILAGPGDDRVFGRRGADFLDGGTGRDYLVGGTKSDLIRARDGAQDVVVCGRGVRDRVIADRLDRVAPDCELVRRF